MFLAPDRQGILNNEHRSFNVWLRSPEASAWKVMFCSGISAKTPFEDIAMVSQW